MKIEDISNEKIQEIFDENKKLQEENKQLKEDNKYYTKLVKGLTKYIRQCSKDNETHTFRGLIAFLKEEGINLEYFEAQDMGLLDFNNELFNLIEDSKADFIKMLKELWINISNKRDDNGTITFIEIKEEIDKLIKTLKEDE